MDRSLAPFALSACVLSVALLGTGCPSSPVCVAGDLRPCTCAGGATGLATCGTDGRVGACVCSDAGDDRDAGADAARVCVASCTSDEACAASCPVTTTPSCCDLTSGFCFVALEDVCPPSCRPTCTLDEECDCHLGALERSCCDPIWGGCYAQAAGACTGCPAGTRPCAGRCVDPQSDEANCGGCASVCGPGERCADGRCTAGAELWERVIEGAEVRAVAADAAGNVYVTGSFIGATDLGGGRIESGGTTKLFVASYGPTGAHRWSSAWGGAQMWGNAIAVDGYRVYVACRFSGPIPFGPGTIPSVGHDACVAVFDAELGILQSIGRHGGAGPDGASSLALRGPGDLTLVGAFSAAADIGAIPVSAPRGDGVFVGRLTAELFGGFAARWARGLDGTALLVASWSTALAPGGVALAGTFTDGTDLGGGPIAAAGGTDVLLGALDVDGAHRWSRAVCAGTGDERALAVATDAAGDVVLLAGFAGDVDCGSGVLSSAGATELALASFDARGAARWSRRIGGLGDAPGAVTTDGSGNVLVAGSFSGELALGAERLSATGVAGFVASLDPGGVDRWARAYARGPSVHPVALAAGPRHGVVALATAPGTSTGRSYLVTFELEGP